jgi:hypothetical protein
MTAPQSRGRVLVVDDDADLLETDSNGRRVPVWRCPECWDKHRSKRARRPTGSD